MTEKMISKLEDSVAEIIQAKQKKGEKRILKRVQFNRPLGQHQLSAALVFLLQGSEEKRKKGTENLLEKIIAENFLNLRKETPNLKLTQRGLHQDTL